MRVSELIQAFRVTVKDDAEPHFWSSETIVGFLNEAVQEACERALLIEDRSISLTTVPGQSTYALPVSAFLVKRVIFRGRPIDETSVEALDCEAAGWESRAGQPRCFVFEPESGARAPQLRLVPTPTSTDAVGLTIYRGALKPLTPDVDMAKPEIPERLHLRLLEWVYHRAFLIQDADTFDPARAATSLALFVQAFGERRDANVQRKQRDRRPRVVRMHW